MNLRYLPLLAIAVVFGCSKSPSSGDVASKSGDTPPVTSPSAGSTTGDTSASTPAPASATTTGTTTESSKPSAGSKTDSAIAALGGKGSDPKAPTAAAPAQATPSVPPPTDAKAGSPSNGAPQMSAGQQKQLQDAMAKRQQMIAANGAKADKATKSVIDGVKGTYKAIIDEAQIPAAVKANPQYKDQIANIKANPPMLVIANDGTVSLTSGPSRQQVTGFTSTVDGKPALIINVPNPPPGMPAKVFMDVQVKDSGSTLIIRGNMFKRV